MDDLPHIPHMPRADSVTDNVLHFLAHEAQVVMRWIVIALMLVTVLTMILFNFWAIIPATLLLLAYGLLMLANAAEKRSAHHRPGASASPAVNSAAAGTLTADQSAAEHLDEAQDNQMPLPLLKHETVMISLGVLVVLVLAAVLAMTVVDWQKVLIAIPFIGAYIVLLSSPAWFAALEDDIEEETHRMEDEG